MNEQLTALERDLAECGTHAACADRVAAFLRGHDLFYGHGAATAEDEAHWLTAACVDWDEDRWNSPVQPATLRRVAAIANRRVTERVPLAYLLGEAWFAGLRFRVTQDVLVPRSPLAELVEAGLAPWCRIAPGARILEIGTGSGCIAIAIACYLDGVTVDATDVSPPALELARENAATLGVADRVRFLEADLFPSGDSLYSVIIANPPYVPAGRLRELPPEYRHEPRLGLVAGDDGLAAVRPILARAAERLEPGGVLIVEVGESDEAVAAAWPRLPFVWIEFEHGGSGVFVLTREELLAAEL